MATSNEDIMKSILTLEHEFIHLQKDVTDIKDSLSCHDKDIRELQDLSLTRIQETKQIVMEVISEYNKTKTVKIQAFAPYFTALIGFAAAMVAIIRNNP